MPFLQHITNVTASPNGAYAAIRVDALPAPIDISPASLPCAMRTAFSSSGALSMLPSDLQKEVASPCTLIPGRDSMGDDMFDVILECDSNIRLRAHAAILAARSTFFKDVLLRPDTPVETKGDIKFSVTSSAGDGQPTIVKLKGCHEITMGLVLELIYTGFRRKYWELDHLNVKEANEPSPATVKAEYFRMLTNCY